MNDLAKPTLVRGGALSPSAWTGAAADVRPDFSTHDAFSERLRKHITTGSGTDEGYGSAPITAPSLPLAALPGDGVGGATRDDTDFMLAASFERLRGHITRVVTHLLCRNDMCDA